MDGRTEGRTDGWTDGRTDGRTDGLMVGRSDGWTDGRMDGWMDGCIDGQIWSVLQEQDEYPSAKYGTFPILKRENANSYLVPQNLKRFVGVGRILQFHAGAGIKQNQLSLPFSRNTKMNVLGHHYFAQKRHETSQIKFKGKMAPMIATKIGPTLRTGMGSTAGARDDSLAAEGRAGDGEMPENGRGKNPPSILEP